VTPSVLRGPRYLRLFPDTYVRRGDEPPNLSVRSRAAGVYVAGRGVVSGYSAAELLGASCAPADAPAEVTVPDGGQRALDLAYPEHRIGIEYEGGDHTRPERVLRDAGRYTWLVDDGWRMYRFTRYEVYGEPDEIAATIDRALGVR